MACRAEPANSQWARHVGIVVRLNLSRAAPLAWTTRQCPGAHVVERERSNGLTGAREGNVLVPAPAPRRGPAPVEHRVLGSSSADGGASPRAIPISHPRARSARREGNAALSAGQQFQPQRSSGFVNQRSVGPRGRPSTQIAGLLFHKAGWTITAMTVAGSTTGGAEPCRDKAALTDALARHGFAVSFAGSCPLTTWRRQRRFWM